MHIHTYMKVQVCVPVTNGSTQKRLHISKFDAIIHVVQVQFKRLQATKQTHSKNRQPSTSSGTCKQTDLDMPSPIAPMHFQRYLHALIFCLVVQFSNLEWYLTGQFVPVLWFVDLSVLVFHQIVIHKPLCDTSNLTPSTTLGGESICCTYFVLDLHVHGAKITNRAKIRVAVLLAITTHNTQTVRICICMYVYILTVHRFNEIHQMS